MKCKSVLGRSSPAQIGIRAIGLLVALLSSADCTCFNDANKRYTVAEIAKINVQVLPQDVRRNRREYDQKTVAWIGIVSQESVRRGSDGRLSGVAKFYKSPPDINVRLADVAVMGDIAIRMAECTETTETFVVVRASESVMNRPGPGDLPDEWPKYFAGKPMLWIGRIQVSGDVVQVAFDDNPIPLTE